MFELISKYFGRICVNLINFITTPFLYLDHCVNKGSNLLLCLILSNKILVASIVVEIMAIVQTPKLGSYIYDPMVNTE